MPKSHSSQDVVQLLEYLYASLDDGDLKPFIRKVQKLTNSVVTFQIVDTNKLHHELSQCADGAYMEEAKKLKLQYLNEYDSPNTIVTTSASAIESGAVIRSSDYASYTDLRKTDYFRGFMNVLEVDYNLATIIELEPSRFSCLNLNRPLGAPDYSESDITLFQQLVPHLQRVSRLSDIFAIQSDRAGLEWSAFDSNGLVAFLLDTDLTIKRSTGSMDDVLSAGQLFCYSGNSLRGATQSVQAALDQIYQTVFSNINTVAVQNAPEEIVKDKRGKTWCLTALLTTHYNPLHMPRAELLIMAKPITVTISVNKVLASRYGLTPAECRCALALPHSYRLIELAEKLHISKNTVRSHLRSVFAKMGVRS